MIYDRILRLNQLVSRKSCFLFGPRQTGKSSLIRNDLANNKTYDLLNIQTFRALTNNPNLIKDELTGNEKIIVIDEIQLAPELLNEVHRLIEECGIKFLLTGSSARKIRKKGVNLLGGRATWKNIYPLVRKEIATDFNLNKALRYGLLPAVYTSTEPLADLRDYVEVYLREEIAAETAIRRLQSYSRFLDTAALCNAQVVNYEKIASDIQMAPTTVREYFYALNDTLLINRVPAWRGSKKRKATAKDKFYFFDIGLARYLQGRDELVEATDDFGSAFESYIFHELLAYSGYVSNEPISYWGTTSAYEVDFLLGDHTAVEVKSTRNVTDKHMRGLKALQEERAFKRHILVSLDPRQREYLGCEVIPYNIFLDKLWANEYK